MSGNDKYGRELLSCAGSLRRMAGYLARREREELLLPLRAKPERLEPFGFKVYSQNDEDGILEEIFRRLNIRQGFFGEIGVQNGLECNSLYLLHKGWSGVWIEGNGQYSDPIRSEFEMLLRNGRLQIVFERITAENINDVLAGYNGGELDFLSVDVDGNDIYLLAALRLKPKVLCIEYNAKFPASVTKRQEYDPARVWSGTDYFGSNITALSEAAARKGYVLVGTNITGANAFFVRKDLHTAHPDVWPAPDPAELGNPPRYWLTEDCFAAVGHPAGFGPYPDLAVSPRGTVMARVEGMRPFPVEVHSLPDSHISPAIRKNGCWEPFETRLFRLFLKKNSVVLDIGANIGWYTLVAALTVKEGGHVFSIEPDNDNFAVLENNIRHNNCETVVSLLHAAASDREGNAFLLKDGLNLGDHRLSEDPESGTSAATPVLSIDSLDALWSRRPDLVKVDAQGHEGHILAGAEKTFAAGWRPVLFLEYWPCQHSKYASAAILDRLAELNYTLFAITGWASSIAPMPFSKLQALVFGMDSGDQTFWDLLAIQRDSPDSELLEHFCIEYVKCGSPLSRHESR